MTRWVPAALLVLLLCVAPILLWGVPLRFFVLKLDDFVYLARSRSISALERHLTTPHNGHVVPLFLLETHCLARLARSLEALPVVLGAAAYFSLVLSMVALGHVVAWETGRPARGLAAMAAVGLSSVLGPAILWYAASQTLATGTTILAMLAALQAWRARGSWWRLAAGVFAAAAAPLFWSAGYAAGPVGMAYLWADGRRFCRVAAVLPLAGSATTGLIIWVIAGGTMIESSAPSGRPLDQIARVRPAATHAAQAVCEALVLNNLGLDATTEPAQALVIFALITGVWAWSIRRSEPAGAQSFLRTSPLEAAGAVLVVAGFAMVFAVRGTETTFDNLRGLGWYDAIPQLGAVLFVAGWCAHPRTPPPRSLEPPRLRQLAGVALFATVILLLQAPRAHRVIFQYDGASAPYRPDVDSNSVATRTQTRADLEERARKQRRALAELDRLEHNAHEAGARRAQLIQAARAVHVPGMPENLSEVGVADLLSMPETDVSATRPHP
jgi:hypothetical protein